MANFSSFVANTRPTGVNFAIDGGRWPGKSFVSAPETGHAPVIQSNPRVPKARRRKFLGNIIDALLSVGKRGGSKTTKSKVSQIYPIYFSCQLSPPINLPPQQDRQKHFYPSS
jgi:hypothetical protein